MRTRNKRILCLASVLWHLASVFSPAFALNSVTVMADSSLSVAVAEIARDYSREHQVVVNTSFAAQSAQETQITEGAAADILITPRQQWIDQLKTRGLIDIYSETPVARNRLALVGPENSPLQVRLASTFPVAVLIQQLKNSEAAFAIGNPEYLPEGIYAKEALRKLGVAADLEPYTVYPQDINQMFDLVANHQAYGIFFYSGVIGRTGLRVIDLLPENSHQPIHYFAVAIAGDNMDEARKFLEYLKSSSAREVFRENGFSVD